MDGPSVSLGSKLSNAKVSFAIFKRDIKRLLVNPVALVVTLGVCVIPSLYAWYNIVANWDPYGNTQGIKIAIANNDRGTQNDLVGELNAGDQVVDQLKENDQLGWTFVDSASDAKEGVESGEYYAAIVIPKNFSDNLVSMLDGNYHQPKLTYYVNEKKSAIAPKVTDTGASTIEEQINSEFVSTVGETVASIAKDAGVDLKDKATQTQDSLASSVSEASDTLGEVRDSIGDMNAAIDKTSGAIASADAALAGMQGQAPSLTQAISQGNDLLGEARTTAGNSIASLSKALSEGSLALTKTSASANAAIGKLTGTVTSTTTRIDNSLESLQATIDHNKAVIGHLEILANDTSTGSEEIDARIVSTINTLREQNEKLQSIKDGLSAQSSAMANDAAAVSGASDAINNAIQTGATNLGQAQTDLGQNALPKASSALDSFAAVSGDLTGIVSGLTPTIASARGTLSQLNATLGQAKTTLSQTDSSLAKVQDKLATAANDIAALQTSESMGELADLMGVDVNDVADFMASPVELASKSIYPVKSFGSGIAPFYTNLALWVGGYVLIAIFKLEVDREGIRRITATQAYLGRWLLLVTIGYTTAIMIFGVLSLVLCPYLPRMLGGEVGFLLGLGFSIFFALNVAMILFLFLPGPARRICRWAIGVAVRARPSLDREKLEKKLEEQLDQYAQGARLIRATPGLLPQVLLMSMGQLACSYAVPYIIYLAFHLTGSSFVEVFALQVLCSISVGYLPLPGAAGAAENVFLRGFAAVFGAGLIAPAMILSRTVSCYLVLIVTGIITALLHFRGRKNAPADTARQLESQDLAA